MATLRRVKVEWSGLTGLPGLSVFYTDSAVDVTTNLATFFSSISNRFPNGLTWSCASSGDEIDDATGNLTGAWTGGTAFSQTGSGGATAYAAGTGAFMNWGTSGIVNSRRLRGRTFLCPILTSEYDTSGTILAAALTTFNTAAGVLVGTGKLQIWHRPPPGGSSGTSSQVVSGSVPDKVTSLRSRRT